MGQTQSSDQRSQQDIHAVDRIYSNYILQQQNLLRQQQQQINDLYKMNLNQVPMNVVIQKQLPSNPDIRNVPRANYSLPALPSTKLNPYQILGISKQYDESSLKKAYLKAAMKTHPDRGGSKDDFQKVSIAYTLLMKKLKEKDSTHHHHDLRKNASAYMDTQSNQGTNIHFDKDKFDIDVFNKIYEENKIEGVYDDGYGEWMKNTKIDDKPKLFQGNFNKDLFNHEFETYKQAQKKKAGSQIVQYEQPEIGISMKNKDSLVNLGQGKISNFSGEANGLNFTDYKAAFTHDSTLIDIETVNIHDRASSIKGVEKERSNISYQMSLKDQQDQAYRQAMQQKEERARMQRLQTYDKQHEDTYHKIHQLLLR